MLYQPNYCCQCGEAIERLDWKLWTSRRFCENCESDFRKQEWLPKLGVGIIFLFGLFGFGSYLKTPEKPLNGATTQIAVYSSNKSQNIKTGSGVVNSNSANSVQNQSLIINNVSQGNNRDSLLTDRRKDRVTLSEDRQNVTTEPVYFCGAQTKKGTPCTRKVKGGGRCWQHLGQPAMFPKEKLIASQ